jgi:hypothetical protein
VSGPRFGFPVLALAACSGSPSAQPANESYTFTPEASRRYPQVMTPNAPTVAQLRRRGLEQSGWDAEPYACGPACDAVHIYAIFMGRRHQHPALSEHRYTCPNPRERMNPNEMNQDEWRCVDYGSMRKRERAHGR